MKALEKDRTRRYETANDFAADVMRHLNNQPVEACPPSRLYHLQKFVRRNRSRIAALGLIGVLGLALAVAVGRQSAGTGRTAGRDGERGDPGARRGGTRDAAGEVAGCDGGGESGRGPPRSRRRRRRATAALPQAERRPGDGVAAGRDSPGDVGRQGRPLRYRPGRPPVRRGLSRLRHRRGIAGARRRREQDAGRVRFGRN